LFEAAREAVTALISQDDCRVSLLHIGRCERLIYKFVAERGEAFRVLRAIIHGLPFLKISNRFVLSHAEAFEMTGCVPEFPEVSDSEVSDS